MSHGYGQLEPTSSQTPSERTVNYEHSKNLAEVLEQLGISILISTYQAGKLAVLGSHNGRLDLSFHNYDSPMGVAMDSTGDRLAVATKDKVWIAQNEVGVGRQLSKPATSCFVTRSAHLTGDIQAHQMAWSADELWIVNTRFSCLCTLDQRHSFVPRWQPPFIDALVAEDRCHLNGLAMEAGKPKFVTALAETNTAEGWRPVKSNAGCLIDVESGNVITRGFAMPHSPVVVDGSIYLLNSGEGALVQVTADGQGVEVGRFPGYSRGLAIHQDIAVVGLSKIRETATFGGLPISERRSDLKCGIAILKLSTGQLLAQFEFRTGVDEIFDVDIIARRGRSVVYGPHATQDRQDAIWVVPTPKPISDP